jgi:hypothetical protein
MLRKTLALTAIALAVSLAPANAAGTNERSKKLIQWGWNAPDTGYVRDHWQEIDKLPLDGIGIIMRTPINLSFRMLSPEVYKHEQFEEAIASLKSAKFKNVKDNFLVIQIGSNLAKVEDSFKWGDDALWDNIANHFSIMARIAKQGGLRGFILDLEGYGIEAFQFKWNKEREGKNYDEFKKLCFARGQQVMKAIQREFPDIQFFLPLGWSSAPRFSSYLPLDTASDKIRFGLIPPFLDGMLDVSLPEVEFHTDAEITYNEIARRGYQYWRAYARKGDGSKVSQFPAKYQKQAKVAFGIWMDATNTGKTWNLTDFDANFFSPEKFKSALSDALEETDEYVWIYSQQPRFFPLYKVPDAYFKSMEEARQSVKN